MRLVDRLRPVLRRISPVAKVVQSATTVLGQLQKPTVFGVVNAVAGAARTIDELAAPDRGYNYSYQSLVPYGDMIEGLRRAGAEIVEQSNERENVAMVYDGELHVRVSSNNELYFRRDPSEDGVLEWCRKAADSVLPPALWLTVHKHELVALPFELTQILPEEATRVWDRTRPMLAGGRGILLEGRPGVGKTTIAQAIARHSGLGRALVFDSNMFSRERGVYLDEHMIRLLSPGVTVIDDLDKISLPLATLELLREHSRLVILTANNGAHDTVLDGALMRPARIDEVFTVTSTMQGPRPPFDRLTQDEWDEVCSWPTAYLNEIEKRLVAHPDDLRLDDLRDRVARRTRSGTLIA